MRTYCNNDVFNALPDNIKSAIKEVNKLSDGGQVDKTLKTTTDKIWIPSYHEVGFSGSSYAVGQQGTQYPIFTDSNSRKRGKFGSSSYNVWWLRSAYTNGSSTFWRVGSSGGSDSYSANGTYGVAPCFCIGKSRLISDSWDEIFASEADGTYEEKYAIGDQKEVELTWSNGTTEKVIYEIADFDHDDLADGSGKAPITWIPRNLLNTSKIINYSQKTHNGTAAYNGGGWMLSDIRTYCNTDVFNALPDNIKVSIKEVNKLSDGGKADKTLKTTADKIWIPSYHEMGFSGNSYAVGQQGTKYPIFTDNNSRNRGKFGSSSYIYWWLRSVYTYNGSYFWSVYSDGSSSHYFANDTCGVAPCFCT